MNGKPAISKSKKKTTFKVLLIPYKAGSSSCKLLSQLTGIKRTKPNHVKNPTYQYLPWGSPLNKLAQYKLFSDNSIACPEWTTETSTVQTWLESPNAIVFARQNLSGHSGDGIVIIRPGDKIPNAPVYTKYIRKKQEFRLHIAFNEIIDIQEKRKKIEDNLEPSLIRNHKNGYVFCRENIQFPTNTKNNLHELALSAAKLIKSPFAAVDIIWNEKQNKYFVLEINTAPGLTDTTATSYANAIKKWVTSLNMNPVLNAEKLAMTEKVTI